MLIYLLLSFCLSFPHFSSLFLSLSFPFSYSEAPKAPLQDTPLASYKYQNNKYDEKSVFVFRIRDFKLLLLNFGTIFHITFNHTFSKPNSKVALRLTYSNLFVGVYVCVCWGVGVCVLGNVW